MYFNSDPVRNNKGRNTINYTNTSELMDMSSYTMRLVNKAGTAVYLQMK